MARARISFSEREEKDRFEKLKRDGKMAVSPL